MKQDYTQVSRNGNRKFYEDAKVQGVLQQYERHLRVVFDVYARMGVELNRNIEEQLESLNLKKMLQFGYDFNVTPRLCLADEYILLYKHLVKEESSSKRLALDFYNFEDFLVRLAILAKGNVGEPKQRKMMNSKSAAELLKKRKGPK